MIRITNICIPLVFSVFFGNDQDLKCNSMNSDIYIYYIFRVEVRRLVISMQTISERSVWDPYFECKPGSEPYKMRFRIKRFNEDLSFFITNFFYTNIYFYGNRPDIKNYRIFGLIRSDVWYHKGQVFRSSKYKWNTFKEETLRKIHAIQT